ncbi:hypothetical protein [Paraburkholderia terrae]|uniref:hypothetical protein n=1 Tax=Paraburkholderia terrae TaxID=311230 RepID=UPI002060E865|nr:hypothetical protein [Paraburkholderia terrae]BDC45324.1 hypothetical protein PTKU15_86210 [Paraburkholderia terrae]
MNEVTLVKVTLNEATDPDLYAYIMRYENPRLRAGAFRALARAALLNDRGHSGAEAIRAVKQPPAATPLLPGTASMQTDEIENKPNPRAAPLLISSETVAPAPEMNRPGNVRRFDTDAIADQFAEF